MKLVREVFTPEELEKIRLARVWAQNYAMYCKKKDRESERVRTLTELQKLLTSRFDPNS
jgi:hypothetical protein